MFKIENVKHLKIYRNKKFFIHDVKSSDKRKGNLFILSSNTLDESIKVMNSELLVTRYVPGYYTDRIVNVSLPGLKKREKADLKTIYDQVKSKTPHITRTFPLADSYKGINMFYDISRYNGIFFNDLKVGSVMRMTELYANYIKGIIDKNTGYKKKTLIIPLDNIGLNRGDKSSIGCMLHMLYANEELFKTTFSGVDMLLVSTNNNILIRVSTETLNRKMLPRFSRLLKVVSKLNSNQPLDDEEKELVEETEREFKYAPKEKETAGGRVVKAITNMITDDISKGVGLAATGIDVWSMLDDEEQDIADKMEERAQRVAEEEDIEDASVLLDRLNNDSEFTEYVDDLVQEKLTAKIKRRNTKRNELLQAEQGSRRINNKGRTLKEILDDYETKKMDREYYDINISNDKLKTSTLRDFEVSYNKKQKDKDTLSILNSFCENKDIPLYIKKIERNNTSTAFDKKETWSILFEDDRRLQHTVTFDMPLFIDDHFLYLSESKKTISHQFLLYPIVKTGPDTVQCTSNYNKAFITRYGSKVSPKMERLKKLIAKSSSKSFKFINGNNSLVNVNYLTNIDYDELASTFMHLEIGNMKIYFNQEILRSELMDMKYNLDKLKVNQLPIAIKDNKEVVILDVKTNLVQGTNMDLPDYIVTEMLKLDKGLKDELDKVNVSKKYVYSRASILSRKLPLLLVLAYKDGLTTVLRKAKIKHEFTENKKSLTLSEKNSLGEIKFADGFLYYELYPFKNSLLLNALQEMPTEIYNFSEFDTKEPYLDIIEQIDGSRQTGKALTNFIELFLDPITLEVCKDTNYPTEFTEFFLYANALLEDNSFIPENKMDLYRIRSNEIINGILYKVLAKAYARYANTANNNTPIKMSIPRDAVLKQINACTIIQDYSIINPIYEADAMGAVTYKGPSGLNLDESFTLAKRSYDESMLGVVGVSSPYNNKVGVSRQLAINPQILNNRGYIKPGTVSDKELDVSNVMTPGEILTPWAGNHDDSPRVAMVSGQSKHIIPVAKTDKLLVGNGSQKTLPHMLGSDFINVAKQDGQVVEIDEKTNLMIVKYKDGTYDSCDLSPKVVKNGGKLYCHII